MGRGDLSDEEWARLEPHLPTNRGRGGRWQSHRRVINGILFRQRTGLPWRDLPPCFGSWKTVHDRPLPGPLVPAVRTGQPPGQAPLVLTAPAQLREGDLDGLSALRRHWTTQGRRVTGLRRVAPPLPYERLRLDTVEADVRPSGETE